MKKISLSIVYIFTLFVATSCGIYSKYERPSTLVTDGVYGDIAQQSDTTLAQLSWQSLFTDSILQSLIERSLICNSDVRIAHLRVEQAEASFMASRLAFIPSVGVPLQGGLSQYGGAAIGATYALPVSASWQVDLFGALHNAHQRSKALLPQSRSY